jgi:p-aminobenzoyl-glutamate transporter AbgT
MKDIFKDLNNLHWWFNIFTGIIVILIAFIITEFFIKPLGKFTKERAKGNLQKTKEAEIERTNTVLQVKGDEREEMRMQFTLASLQRIIFFRLCTVIVIIPAMGGYLLISFLPIKISLILFALWVLVTNVRQLIGLFRYQNYCIDILDRVAKD